MRYRIKNEMDGFDFNDTYVEELKMEKDTFIAILNNVTILEKNSQNKDIRDMRTNGLVLTIQNAQLKKFAYEGYKLYNADGVFEKEVPDIPVEEDKYIEVLESLHEAKIGSIEKNNDIYDFIIEMEMDSYCISFEGTDDIEEWDRFLSIIPN